MRRFAARTRSLIAAAALAALAGCAVGGPTGPTLSQLADARKAWEAAGITTYEYTLRRACFCVPDVIRPVTVRVQGGSPSARMYASSGEPVDPRWANLFPAVEGLFQVIEDALGRRADTLLVDYHPALGYPTSITIDYSHTVADDELTITVTGLAPTG